MKNEEYINVNQIQVPNENSDKETGTLLINGKINKDSQSLNKIIKKPDKEDVEVPAISYFTLFRYTSTLDILFIAGAIISTIITGCVLPFNTIVFANVLNAMAVYGIKLMSNSPDDYESEFMTEVKWFSLYYLILGGTMMIFSYLAVTMMSYAAYNQIYKIRQEYLKAAINQDFAYYDLHETGDFAAKMSDDVVKLEDGIGEKVVLFLHYMLSFVSSVTMALYKGWELALVCLVSFPVTVILVGSIGYVAARLGKQESVAYGKASAVAEEVLSSIKVVMAFGGQQKEVIRFQHRLNEAKQINIKRSFFTGGTMGALFLCIYCTYALSFWYAVKLHIERPEQYDVATMVSVFLGVIMGSMFFGFSSSLIEVFGIAKGAGAQIFTLIDNKPKINPLEDKGLKPDSIEGEIELRDVHFKYPSRPDIPVLKGLTLKIKRGQRIALVGSSGCGKSTIVQLISRFYDVDSGMVLIDNNDVRNVSVNWLRSKIGVVSQEPVLFNTSIGENIRYGREDATQEEIETAAKMANAHHFISALPKGYNATVGDRGTQLSGGQKQRIAIARALLRNPTILLLDEATSALDNKSERKVQVALDKAHDGRTTIIVAHRLSTIRNVDVIYAMKDGVVVESGSHSELMSKKGLYYSMVNLQTLPNDLNELAPAQHRKDSIEIQANNVLQDIKEIEDESEKEKAIKVSFLEILAYSKPETKFIVFGCLSCILQGLAVPLFGVIFGDFIGVLSQDSETIKSETNKYALYFVAIGLGTGFTAFINAVMFGIAGEYLTERLRRRMFETMLRQEVAWFDDKKNSTGALCAKLSGEASYVQGATGQRIGTVLQAISSLSVALGFAMYYEYRVGLVSLAFTPIIIFVLYKQVTMAVKESYGTAITMENSTKLAVDVISNIRTVASLGREKIFLESYAAELKPGLILVKRGTHLRGFIYGVSRSVINFLTVIAMYYGSILIISEGIPYDRVIKTVQAMIMCTSSVANSFAFAPNFQKGINAAQRIISLFRRIPKIQDPVKPVVQEFNAIGDASYENILFAYPTRPEVAVLDDLSLNIKNGETVALVGQSGCGKSTVLQLLCRFYDPQSGTISIDNTPIKDVKLSELRKNLGVVQQEPILFDRTIAENIAYGDNSRNVSQDEIINAAKQSNIHNFIVSLPLGYETRLGTKGTQLSGGQKQRIAIARSLVRNPKILLLDEATSALDVESEKVVQEALDKAKQGRTCITIAHRLSTIQDADVIFVFHEGKVCEMGTHTELMKKKGLYYSLQMFS